MFRILAATFILLGPLPALAQPPAQNRQQVNLAVVDEHVLPRYQAFAQASRGLGGQAEGLCENPNEAGLADLRATYHASMDAWQGIQHVQFGPITYFNWNYRLQFWPDERDTGGRQLNSLIAAGDAEALSEDNFPRQSVGVQGFPALERLLFETDSLARLRNEPFRCEVMQTIARNIQQIADDVHARWVNEYRAEIANAQNSDFFESDQDATIDLLKALVETVPKLRDQKIAAPLGQSFSAARDRRAESWRSERSLRNMKINVEALRHLYQGAGEDEELLLGQVFLPQDTAAISAHFVSLRDTLQSLPDSMTAALQDEAQYARLVELQSGLDALYEALERALKNTDLYLGFNSLDGD